MSDGAVHIIDDDEAVGRALTALTRAAGHEVVTYLSATAFLEALDTQQVGCVLTDVRMPGMNGLDLLRELRRRDVYIPVIVMSGQADIPMAVEALKLGAVDFIEKPFDTAAYLDRIAQALARSEGLGRRQALLATAKSGLSLLTQREREVMSLTVQGFSNFGMASQLGISARTIENHRAKVMEKMGAGGLSDLIRMALALEAG
jgi:two-component system response regulator FixJ